MNCQFCHFWHLKCARRVHAQIAHEEELGDQCGDVFNDRDQNAKPTNAQSEENGTDRFPAGVRFLEGAQEGNDIFRKTKSGCQ